MLTATDPLFTLDVTSRDALCAADLVHLASGTSAAVQVPEFIDRETCAAATRALDRLPLSTYDPERVPTQILRFGPAVNDYRTTAGELDADRYWPAADRARLDWNDACMRPDVLGYTLARLGTLWGDVVSPATIGGRPVFGGTARETLTGTLIHYDSVAREHPHGLFDQLVVAQLAVNVWVRAPHKGGETAIWRRRWEPRDDHHRDAYGYTPEVIDGCQHVTVEPAVGDLLLFNAANLHAAQPCTGKRTAIAFFLGITAAGRLIHWS